MKCYRCNSWPCNCRDSVALICGDNCDVMGLLPKESVDLVVTSPPYDDLRTYGGHSWDFYGVAWNLKRLLKPGGVIVWVVNDKTEDGSETGTGADQARHFRQLGLNQHDTMIYHKNGAPFPESNRYYPVWEYMYVMSKGSPSAFNLISDRANKWAGTSHVSCQERQPNGQIRVPRRIANYESTGVRHNIWTFDTGKYKTTKDDYAFNHPAIFPEALAHDHIISWSNKGNLVLDPFNGSGTTTKMAKLTGRRAIGIEINEEYLPIAANRLRQEVLQFTE